MGLATEGEEAAMPRGWEGNRRSGIALDMRHRLQRFIHLLSHGLRKGDEHPSYTSHGVWPVVYWGVYAGIRRIPTSGFF